MNLVTCVTVFAWLGRDTGAHHDELHTKVHPLVHSMSESLPPPYCAYSYNRNSLNQASKQML